MNTEQLLLGTTANLYVLRFSRFGVYLGSGTDRNFEVLLPNNQVSDSLEKGDKIDVFLYKDSEDRLIATTAVPYLQMGEVAALKVQMQCGWTDGHVLYLPERELTVKARSRSNMNCVKWVSITLFGCKFHMDMHISMGSLILQAKIQQ